MHEKLMSLSKAADLIRNDMLLSFGGNGMHRNPVAFALALTKRPLKSLRMCGAAPGIATDIMMPQSCEAYFGFFGLENEAGLAPGMRKAMEGANPTVKAYEGS